MSLIRVTATALLVALTGVGCSAAAPTDPPATPADVRCKPVDEFTIAQLLQAIDQGLSVRNAYYVRSNDYAHTLFVSGDLEGPGLEGSQDIGTWAIDLAGGHDTFYEMNDMAGQHGGWIPGAHDNYSMSDDGAQLSAQCARAAGASPEGSPAGSAAS